MKILARVSLITERSRQGEDGEEARLTIVKLAPANINTGDITLGFSKADVVYHTGAALFDRDGSKSKTMIEPNGMIVEANCYVKGEVAYSFKAHRPGFTAPAEARAHGFGWPDVEEREAPLYEIEINEVAE